MNTVYLQRATASTFNYINYINYINFINSINSFSSFNTNFLTSFFLGRQYHQLNSQAKVKPTQLHNTHPHHFNTSSISDFNNNIIIFPTTYSTAIDFSGLPLQSLHQQSAALYKLPPLSSPTHKANFNPTTQHTTP